MESYQGKKWERDAINNFDKLLPTTQQLDDISRIAELALKTGYLAKDVNSVEKVEYIIIKGLEVGMQPAQALAQISIIGGKPAIGAEGMMNLIRKNCPSAKILYEEQSDLRCSMIVKREESDKPQRFEFTLKDAERAHLIKWNKDRTEYLDLKESSQYGDKAYYGSWCKYPVDMLRSRCITRVGRAVFPDAIGGISYTPEELGATVDMDGNIMDKPTSMNEVLTKTAIQAQQTRKEELPLENKEAESKRIVKATKKAKHDEELLADLEREANELKGADQ
jgi:hypothetical protein